MSTFDKSINTASKEELLEFATSTLNLDVASLNAAQIRAAIKASGYRSRTIPVDESTHNGRQNAAQAALDVPLNSEDEYVIISIPATNDPGGDDDIPVAVNGSRMDIMRNVPVKVPRHFYEALMNALTGKYQMTDTDGLGRKSEVAAFPMMVLPADTDCYSKEDFTKMSASEIAELRGIA